MSKNHVGIIIVALVTAYGLAGCNNGGLFTKSGSLNKITVIGKSTMKEFQEAKDNGLFKNGPETWYGVKITNMQAQYNGEVQGDAKPLKSLELFISTQDTNSPNDLKRAISDACNLSDGDIKVSHEMGATQGVGKNKLGVTCSYTVRDDGSSWFTLFNEAGAHS